MSTKRTIKKPKVKVLKRIGRPIALPGVWGELAKAAGNVEALGREMGKSVRQIRRLAHRESPLAGSTRVAAMSVATKYKMQHALEEWERVGA